jgi:hypothetical protein
MRPSLRFLGIAVLGWAGFRAWTAGALPAGLFSIERSEAKPPPIIPTQFPQIEPVEPATPNYAATDSAPAYVQPQYASYGQQPYYQQAGVRYVQGLIGVPVSMGRGVVPVYQLPPAAPPASELPPRPTRLANAMPTPTQAIYPDLPPLGDWPLSAIAGISHPATRSTVVLNQSTPLDPRRIDRVQLTMWALLRQQQPGTLPSSSLASGGQLGGSQAGARFTYNFTRQIAASLRTTTEVGQRGGEVAAGIRVQPLVSLPIWVTAERRQRLGPLGDRRNAFALFFEGGVYQRPMPWQFNLDAYLQGGVVGLHSRDLFIDGAATLTRPVYKNFSAGLGVWGGAQPGLYRVDAGPRVTMQVRRNVRVHFDWRQRLAGTARPGSGPAVTLAGDF